MDSKDNKIIIYQDENGVTKISVRFADEDLWLTQAQLAEIYDTTQQNISQHIDGIYSDGELDREATNKKFLLVREEGMRQVVWLERMIIIVGKTYMNNYLRAVS